MDNNITLRALSLLGRFSDLDLNHTPSELGDLQLEALRLIREASDSKSSVETSPAPQASEGQYWGDIPEDIKKLMFEAYRLPLNELKAEDFKLLTDAYFGISGSVRYFTCSECGSKHIEVNFEDGDSVSSAKDYCCSHSSMTVAFPKK